MTVFQEIQIIMCVSSLVISVLLFFIMQRLGYVIKSLVLILNQLRELDKRGRAE